MDINQNAISPKETKHKIQSHSEIDFPIENLDDLIRINNQGSSKSNSNTDDTNLSPTTYTSPSTASPSVSRIVSEFSPQIAVEVETRRKRGRPRNNKLPASTNQCEGLPLSSTVKGKTVEPRVRASNPRTKKNATTVKRVPEDEGSLDDHDLETNPVNRRRSKRKCVLSKYGDGITSPKELGEPSDSVRSPVVEFSEQTTARSTAVEFHTDNKSVAEFFSLPSGLKKRRTDTSVQQSQGTFTPPPEVNEKVSSKVIEKDEIKIEKSSEASSKVDLLQNSTKSSQNLTLRESELKSLPADNCFPSGQVTALFHADFTSPLPLKIGSLNGEALLSPLDLNISSILDSSLSVDELLQSCMKLSPAWSVDDDYYDTAAGATVSVVRTNFKPQQAGAMSMQQFLSTVDTNRGKEELELPVNRSSLQASYRNSQEFFLRLQPNQSSITFFECPLCYSVFLEKIDVKVHFDQLCPKLFEKSVPMEKLNETSAMENDDNEDLIAFTG